MLRLFNILIFVDLICLINAALEVPVVLTYPGTGITFTVMMIAMSFVGRIDFYDSERFWKQKYYGGRRKTTAQCLIISARKLNYNFNVLIRHCSLLLQSSASFV